MVRETVSIPESAAAATPAEHLTGWLPAYVLSLLPLSLFLYVNTFQEARSFFAGYSGSFLVRFPWLVLLLMALAGVWVLCRLPLAGRRWIAGGWLALGVTAGLLLWENAQEWGRVAALALCVPGWIGLSMWLPNLWHRSLRPVGRLREWMRNGLVFATAVVLAFAANTSCILLIFPEFSARPTQGLFLLGHVAALAGAGAGLLMPLFLVPAWLAPLRHGGRMALLAIGLALELAMVLVFFNGLGAVDPFRFRPVNFLYALAASFPLIVLFCRRVAEVGQSVAEGLIDFGRNQLPARWRRAIPALCLVLFAGVQILLGRAHAYYEFGFATGLLYLALGVAWTWYLLTALPRSIQVCVTWATMGGAVLGLATFITPAAQKVVWANYIKFDKNLGSMLRAYYSRHPRTEAEFQRLRRILDRSHLLVATNLTDLRRQRLTLLNQSQRPHVFIVVVDALRQETYGGTEEQRQSYPGLAWMASRFAVYDNTWTSYNSTMGSYAAFLNGALTPAWYRINQDFPVEQDNILFRAAQLAGYRCYNLATFSVDFSKFWPENASARPVTGGLGLGDPGAVFPRALELLDQHCNGGAGQPALFYLHLYNLHQPLLRRPETPFKGEGLHWMRALYEHNAHYLDRHLHTFLQGLDQRRLLDDALVVITSDHGEEVFDLGGLYHGWQINPWVMHVPLFIHYPKTQTGTPSYGAPLSRPVNLIDVAPTICRIMGAPIVRDSPWQGIGLLEPEPAQNRSFLLLSWQTPLVGQVTFAPTRLTVVNLESGEVELFAPDGKGWSALGDLPPPARVANLLGEEVRGMFHYWHLDPEGAATASDRR